MNLKELDLKHIWHPCTQMKDHEFLPLLTVKNAKGVYLYDYNNKAYIDCISSWWVNLFGHCNEYINSKITEQLSKLEHVLLAGCSHEGVIRLSARLCKILEKHKLNKCFYADNGSSSIEIALKMAFHYFANKNEKRKKFLALSNSYHGETVAALSVGDVKLYKKHYEDLLLDVLLTPVAQGEDFSKELEFLEKLLEKEGENICAFILEPLIQCAGNMHMYSANFIDEATKLCRKYGILIIFDEVAVGFGRTNTMFALEQSKAKPDLLCLSKGITGGYLPLSVLICTDEIYNAFYDDYEKNKAFLHSHSYTGNALACAAANAVLDIFENDNVLENNKILSKFIKNEFESLKEFDFLGNFRQCGMVYAFDIIKNKRQRAGLFVYEKALEKGLLLRPLANTIYFMPPFVIKNDEVSYVVSSLREIFSTNQL